jgi:DNA uptake protein ComE-like DNA-binding protein
MWKDFFYFSKRERQGIVVLIVLIAGIFIGKYLFYPVALPKTAADRQDVAVQYAVADTGRNFIGYNPPKTGLIEEKRTYYAEKPQSKPVPQKSSVQKNNSFQEKLPAGAVIELNSADTATLKKVPGIGSSFARRITGYRRLLGGYYRKEQLQEVYGMYEELFEKISPFFTIDTAQIESLDINKASLDRLRAHPYIDFYKAKAIVELRKKTGKIERINELEMFEEFSAEDLEKLQHYLKFE